MRNNGIHFSEDVSPFTFGKWWVDDRGVEHSASEIDSSFDSLFLHHLGQVKLSVSANSVKIEWVTNNVENDALAFVLEQLSRYQSNVPIELYFFYFGWVGEIYTDRHQVIERILQIQKNRSIEVLHPTMISNRDFSEIKNASLAIRQGFELWDTTAGRYDEIAVEKLADYLRHTINYQFSELEDELIFSWVGPESPSARIYGRKWATDIVGELSINLSEKESPEYVEKISTAMQHTFETGEPQLQHIRARMEDVNTEPFWLSYERLITSHRLLDGREGISVLCNLTQNLSIPLAGGP